MICTFPRKLYAKGAIQEAARLKNEENIIIELKKVEDIVPIAIKPVIGVHINELDQDKSEGTTGIRNIEFIATGQSPAGIEFYSWDFAYNQDKGFKPTIIIDKDGLENTEIITLKINGVIEQVK